MPKIALMDWNLQVLVIFPYGLPLGSCVWGPNQYPKVVLIGLLRLKLWEWNIILIKTIEKNNNLSTKSCHHGLKSSTLTNFFSCFWPLGSCTFFSLAYKSNLFHTLIYSLQGIQCFTTSSIHARESNALNLNSCPRS